MSYGAPQGPYDRFRPIDQSPYGAPLPQPHDPPGYYRGWPLANIAKRSAAAFLDWVVFWFIVLMSAGFIAAGVQAIAGQRAGEVVGFIVAVGSYGALFYNFGILQSRTGQSWGKRVMGLRTVRMEDLRPAGKATLSLRPFFEVFEIFTGVAFISATFSYYRQTLVDKFCGIVVLDERRAGMTLPWTLPQEPEIYVERPQPQGGVARPQRLRDSGRDERDEWFHPQQSGRVVDEPTESEWDLPGREVDDDYDAPAPPAPAPPPPPRRYGDSSTRPTRRPNDKVPKPAVPPKRTAKPVDDSVLPPLGGYERNQLPLPPGLPEAAPQSPGDGRFIADAEILDAIRAKDWDRVILRARAMIDTEFDNGVAVDIDEAIGEFRNLIRFSGSDANPPDKVIARWLGLSD